MSKQLFATVMADQAVARCSFCDFVTVLGFDKMNGRDELRYRAHLSKNHYVEAFDSEECRLTVVNHVSPKASALRR